MGDFTGWGFPYGAWDSPLALGIPLWRLGGFSSGAPMGGFPSGAWGDSPSALGIPLRRLGFLSCAWEDFSLTLRQGISLAWGIPSQDSSLGFLIETETTHCARFRQFIYNSYDTLDRVRCQYLRFFDPTTALSASPRRSRLDLPALAVFRVSMFGRVMHFKQESTAVTSITACLQSSS